VPFGRPLGEPGQAFALLEQFADLSEQEGYYPNLSFGKTNLVVSITPRINRIALEEEEYTFAAQVDALVDQDS
jgi:pterin-4a-carbinolamine dehydratase